MGTTYDSIKGRMLVCCSARLVPVILLATGCGTWDEPIYRASRQVEKRWEVGERPRVVVQLQVSGTHVTVTGGEQGEISSSLRIGAVSTISQADADQRVRTTPGARFVQEGDTVQVVELPGNIAACAVDLVVPPDSDIEIEAPSAEIRVGLNGMGSHVPIPIVRLKATTERILSVYIESPSFGPPVLDLEAWRIDLTIDGEPVETTQRAGDLGAGARYQYKQP